MSVISLHQSNFQWRNSCHNCPLEEFGWEQSVAFQKLGIAAVVSFYFAFFCKQHSFYFHFFSTNLHEFCDRNYYFSHIDCRYFMLYCTMASDYDMLIRYGWMKNSFSQEYLGNSIKVVLICTCSDNWQKLEAEVLFLALNSYLVNLTSVNSRLFFSC